MVPPAAKGLKKPGLDVSDMANYRPVSNLTFLSKVIEQIVAQQLNDYLAANNLLTGKPVGIQEVSLN